MFIICISCEGCKNCHPCNVENKIFSSLHITDWTEIFLNYVVGEIEELILQSLEGVLTFKRLSVVWDIVPLQTTYYTF